MDTTVDDNFFIEEPQKLRNNFFNKDKSSLHMVELLAQKHRDNDKRMQLGRIQAACRLAHNKKLQPIQCIQQPSTMPSSFITRLENLCQATYKNDDICEAKSAVDTLVNASKKGCCFLERYIVMLLNFCAKKHPLSDDNMRIKIEELMNRVMIVDFDRHQLAENLRRPEYKLTSIEHIIHLLQRAQDMLDYREETAINWLFVLLDAYFVEIATTDRIVDIIDQISAHINFQCALLNQMESTKCLLNSILEQLNGNINNNPSKHKRPYYSIELLEI